MKTTTPRHLPRLLWSALGLITAIACAWAVEAASTERIDPAVLSAAAYLAVWIPLLVALVLSFAGQSAREAAGFLGLRFHALDALWGIGLGCMGRAFDAFLRLLLTGSTGLVQQPTLSAIVYPGTQVVAFGIIAPILIAPVIEEIYFRGLIQRALATAFEPLGNTVKWVIAVVVTSLTFALVHAFLLMGTPREALLAGISTFFFALLAGATAAATKRLGGSVVGHVVFNGLAVILTWPS